MSAPESKIIKKDFWLDHFPPQKFLTMPSVGIDISDRSIKYIQLTRKGGIIVIQKKGSIPLAEGIISSGEIKNKEKLIELMRSIKEEINTPYIIAAMPEEKTFLSRIKLPLMKRYKIKEALELQLEEHVPLTHDNAVFDFEIIKEKTSGPDNHIDVNIIAFPKDIVNDYVNIFKEAGLTPLAFEMEVQALARAVVPQNDDEAYVVVDFGKTRTTLAIACENKIQFTSTIKIAGDDLNNAITKNLKVDIFRAEKIKKEQGFVRTKDNEEVFNALLPVISTIKDEISRHISFWNSHLKTCDRERSRVKKILIGGGDSNLFGFSEYLSYNLKMPVEQYNPWINLISFDEYVPDMELKESLLYATAIGLALRSLISTKND